MDRWKMILPWVPSTYGPLSLVVQANLKHEGNLLVYFRLYFDKGDKLVATEVYKKTTNPVSSQ